MTDQSFTFVLADVELETAQRFIRKHNKRHGQDRSVSGGRFSYIFTPTAIGTAVTVRCACGKTKDVSDYDSW